MRSRSSAAWAGRGRPDRPRADARSRRDPTARSTTRTAAATFPLCFVGVAIYARLVEQILLEIPPGVLHAFFSPGDQAGARVAVGIQPARPVLLFVGLMLSMLLASLNQTVLSTALPTIVGELNGVNEMLWVITAFILASTIMMPVYGKLGDLMGRKALLMAAIVLFMAGSVVGALAGNMEVLITARVIQGLGGGGLMILSQAIIADVVSRGLEGSPESAVAPLLAPPRHGPRGGG